jgi:hypothetical protein
MWKTLRDGSWIDLRSLVVVSGIMVGLFVACWAHYLGGPGYLDPHGKPVGSDFAMFYGVSRALLDGAPAESLYVPATFDALVRPFTNGQSYVWMYPPIAFLPFWPLGLLPYPLALAAWLAVGFVLYLATVGRILPTRASVALAAISPAALVMSVHGHVGFVLAAALGFGLALLPTRPSAAGILLGLTAMKPHLVLLVPIALVAGRQWRALLVAGLTVLSLAVLAAGAVGLQSWLAFLAAAPIPRAILELEQVPYFKIASVFAGVRLVGGSVAAAYAAQLVTSVIAVATVAWVWGGRAAHELRCAALLVAALLATPYVYDYDLVVLSVVIAFLARLGIRDGWLPWEKTGLAAAWLAPLFARPLAAAFALQVVPLVLACGLVLVARRTAAAAVRVGAIPPPGAPA